MGHWAASPDPSGSQKCIFFPWPNGLLMELAYLYLTQKIPKWYGNREISSQLVVGLVVVGGNLVINLLPFTSSRIDSEETKRKRRGRGRKKPCVSDHLGKLRETRLNCLYLHQSCLTIGDQGVGGSVRGQPGAVSIYCPSTVDLTVCIRYCIWFVQPLCQMGLFHPLHSCSFIHSFILCWISFGETTVD